MKIQRPEPRPALTDHRYHRTRASTPDRAARPGKDYISGLLRKSTSEIIKKIKNGLPYRTFEELCTAAAIGKVEAVRLVDISARTLERRKQAGRFERAESDRILRIFEVVAAAKEAFDDEESALSWLKSPETSFGNKTPLDYSDTEIGANEVKDLLGRIEHGVF